MPSCYIIEPQSAQCTICQWNSDLAVWVMYFKHQINFIHRNSACGGFDIGSVNFGGGGGGGV